jgi:hypothetical protein
VRVRGAGSIVERARALDVANVVRVRESNALAEELEMMRRLVREADLIVPVPSSEQVRVLGSAADMTAGRLTPYARDVSEPLEQRRRRSHESYALSWADAIAKAVAAIVGTKQEEAA